MPMRRCWILDFGMNRGIGKAPYVLRTSVRDCYAVGWHGLRVAMDSLYETWGGFGQLEILGAESVAKQNQVMVTWGTSKCGKFTRLETRVRARHITEKPPVVNDVDQGKHH